MSAKMGLRMQGEERYYELDETGCIVINGLAAGKYPKEIASENGLSIRCVEYRIRMLKKITKAKTSYHLGFKIAKIYHLASL